MKILLVQPEWKAEGIGFRLAAMPEPLALEILAAWLTDDDVRILDLRIDNDLIGTLEKFDPDIVACTALTTEVYNARDVLRRTKEFDPRIVTVAGGHHCSLLPQDFCLPYVDVLVIGEGEISFQKLVRAVERGESLVSIPGLIVQLGNGEFQRADGKAELPVLDASPLPRRDLCRDYRDEYYFLFDKPDAAIATSRGCPYTCNFCSVWTFNDRLVRSMSAGRVVDELKSIDTEHVTFLDDIFFLNGRRDARIADMIRAEGIDLRYSCEARTDSIASDVDLVKKWVDVGLYAVLLGLEGATDGALNSVNKRNTVNNNDRAIEVLKDLGVIIWGAFIVDPDFDRDDFRRLRDYVSEKEITHTQFTILTPLPGTQLYEERYDELLTDDYDSYDTLHSVLPTRLPREEFYYEYSQLYSQVDVRPYLDLMHAGKLTIENLRQGREILDQMQDYKGFFPGDPILGGRGGKGRQPPPWSAEIGSRAAKITGGAQGPETPFTILPVS
jgi:radical SAM superfamily enzyme YgiQ (UPF0313 family)